MDEGDAGTKGADMKLFPRGVGKWSLMGENQSAFLDWSRPLDSSSAETPLADSSSSSIIVLSDRRFL